MSPRKVKRNLLPFYKGRRAAQIAFMAAFSLPIVAALAIFVFMPIHQQRLLQRTEKTEKISKQKIAAPSASLAEKMSALQIEEAYYKSLMYLSKKDSVMLSLDLHDSLLAILIKGVPVRQCSIKKISMSHAIRHFATRDTMHSWLYPPFTLQKEWATIPKAPIRIMDAPKDTIEANAMAGEEIPIEKNDVHFSMQFNKGLTVVVEQVQTPNWQGRKKKWKYDLDRIFSEARRTLYGLMEKKLPQHKLWIEVSISREDGKAIYRATPAQLQMALRL